MSEATFTFRVDQTLKTRSPWPPRLAIAPMHNFCVTSCANLSGNSRKWPSITPGSVTKYSLALTRPTQATCCLPPMSKPGLLPVGLPHAAGLKRLSDGTVLDADRRELVVHPNYILAYDIVGDNAAQ